MPRHEAGALTVTIQDPIQVGLNTWRFLWSSDQDDPTFRIYIDGRFVRATKSGHGDFPLNFLAGQSGLVEVLDDDSTPTTAIAAQVLLAWANVSETATYRVERLVDEAWVVIKEVAADQDRLHYETPVLAGQSSVHEFRVTAIGENENEGTPVEVDILMTRHPDPPIVGYTYSDGTKKVTVAAA